MTSSKTADVIRDRIAAETLDGLSVGLQLIGPDFRYRYLNQQAVRHARLSADQLIGRTMMEVFPGIESTDMFAELKRCMVERTARRVINEFRFPDGSKAYFELAMEPVGDDVAILSTDITTRRKSELCEGRTHRAHTVLGECNQYLVRATDERRLMQEVCRIAVERGGYKMAWIGLCQPEPECSVQPVAQAGHDDGYLAGLGLSWDENSRGFGPAGRAVRTGEPAVIRFIGCEAELPWRDAALARGFQSTIALPLSVDGRAIGALCIYAGEPDAFDTSECELLREMALDLSYGIASLRARAEQRRSLELRDRLEQELMTLNAELEARVQLRTRELEAARNAAQSANRAKSEFLANMSHKTRTPMNIVLGFAQLLQRAAAITPAQREYVDAINRAGQQLVELLDEIMLLAEAEAAGQSGVPEARDSDSPAHQSSEADEDSVAAPESGIACRTSSARMRALPRALRDRIIRASMAADLDVLLALVEEAGTYDADLAARLRELAERYDYVPIVELVRA